MLVRIVVPRNSTVQPPNGLPVSNPYNTTRPDRMPYQAQYDVGLQHGIVSIQRAHLF
jgi:hypothetical protein